LPWWTTVLLRLWQGRPWLHRVAGRSLLIGDVPWVAQSAEAFLSKLFALSYSIAGLSVASANPMDHLVHRHTHRVVRGCLLAVGRPDGRLNALTAAENTVCLSVNQASSIQNYGVTCESITIGHNPSKLPLTANAIFLPRHRPNFFSEHVVEGDGDVSKQNTPRGGVVNGEPGGKSKFEKALSTGALMGRLTGVAASEDVDDDDNGINDVFDAVIAKNTSMKRSRQRTQSKEEMEEKAMRDLRQILPLRGQFVGSWMAFDKRYQGLSNQDIMQRQYLVQALYETRCASLHRFVSFLVMFHALGKAVADFWPRVSCGLLGYDMSRTHSIMRIATTASPVSGMEVREKTLELADSTARAWARRIFQMLAASWFVSRERGDDKEEDEEKTDAMMRILYASGGGEKFAQSFRRGTASFAYKKVNDSTPAFPEAAAAPCAAQADSVFARAQEKTGTGVHHAPFANEKAAAKVVFAAEGVVPPTPATSLEIQLSARLPEPREAANLNA